jgi:adenine-specific DNA-methyltransferase
MASLKWRDLWQLYCSDLAQDELDRCAWLQAIPAEWPSEGALPVDVCDWLADLYVKHAEEQHRRRLGQFFTPPIVARFMAGLGESVASECRVLEPGAGLGILVAAVAERVVQDGDCREWHAVAYETDAALRPALTLALGYLRQWLNNWGVRFTFEVTSGDFIIANTPLLRPAPLLEIVHDQPRFQYAIANPPYFKIPKTDPRAAIMADVVHGQPNIYALFIAAATKLLQPGGRFVFITPRSFCSGPYFRQFRRWFFGAAMLARIHVFGSRTEAFARDEVLQENIIFEGRTDSTWPDTIGISRSVGTSDLSEVTVRCVPMADVLDLDSADMILRIPVGSADSTVRSFFGQWSNRLHTFGLAISTGPVVPFRTSALRREGGGATTVPLVWVQHVQRMAVTWPLLRFDKPQWINATPDTFRLLLPNRTYVFVRRFSAKEENSRITAAPYFEGTLRSDFLGVENHVNYIHRPGGRLSEVEALGLTAFLNSRWVEQYFRLSSGNTQVSAAELRDLPLPPLDSIRRIGERLRQGNGVSHIALLNRVVEEELGLPQDLRNGNGGHMSKIEEAKDLLNMAGLPPAQRNELAALTLLALANLSEDDPWRKAERRSIRIHDMILFVEQRYHKRYAENTRETFRRQVLHQFEQARIVDRNPDDPSLPTNSPRTHYALSKEFLSVVQHYGTRAGQRHAEKFRAEQGTLLEMYQRRRERHLIPLKDAQGREYRLSPGKHNQLQVAIVEQFAPRFAPGAKLLYMGDTANKTLIIDPDRLKQLGFPASKHSKLPDVVLHLPKKNWLFLIEVVTSHGPVSPKRHRELERLLTSTSSGRVYVSAFLDFKEFLRHARHIAWETEVWIAEAPDHLIHFNGDRFIGPQQKSASNGR